MIGHGNVALDVARILAKPVDDLRTTDIADRALDVLSSSQIRDIHLIGRKGPDQARFSPKELRELEALDSVAVELHLDPKEDELTNWSEPVPAALKALASRTVSLPKRRIHLHFGTRPLAFLGEGKLDAVSLKSNERESKLACEISFRSIGYLGDPMQGLPFDPLSGRIPNILGRVIPVEQELSPVYVTGWAKRGPSGIIGTNRADSRETVAVMLDDLQGHPPHHSLDPQIDPLSVLDLKPNTVVDCHGWFAIDRVELEQGRLAGRPRRKLTTMPELMAAAGL